MNEVCKILVGHKINNVFIATGLDRTVGQPASVAFDYRKVYNYFTNPLFSFVGFYHTHPSFLNEPSSIDYRTMVSWVDSLGKPLLCAIEGINGLAGHWFFPDGLTHKTYNMIEWSNNLYIGDIPNV